MLVGMRAIAACMCILLITFNVYANETLASSRDCTKDDWFSIPTGNLFNSAEEIALLDAGSIVTYGNFKDENGLVTFRQCELNFRDDIIKIPVFLVDWQDFEPSTDVSNPNNPDSITGDGYKKLTVQEVENYLAKNDSIARYFEDVSGGRLKLQFDVFGWMNSGSVGSHIKNHAEYLFIMESDQNWYCNRSQVMKDTLKEAYLNHGFNPNDYDINYGKRGHSEGFLNGAILIYEGDPGLCSGNNMSIIDGIGSISSGEVQEQAGIEAFNMNTLVSENAVDQAKIDQLDIQIRTYINLSENNIYDNYISVWNHELGHLLLGYSDHYFNQYNIGSFGLSASSFDVHSQIQPAGFEKWLFAKWIEPEEIVTNNNYVLATHDIADGDDYISSEHYLYKFIIDDDPAHILLIEYRWLSDAGNDNSSWVMAGSGNLDEHPLESGLQIFEIDYRKEVRDVEPYIYRHARENRSYTAWKSGTVFYQCFELGCIRISEISELQQHISFRFELIVDSDEDGIADTEDAFPDDPTEWLDTDNDGVGNNADTDDDNDEVTDSEDAFSLDSSESVDTDNDGVGNNGDTDDDNDGVLDSEDQFPIDSSESVDSDNDGVGNNGDTDDDNDGVLDSEDQFPLDSSESVDTDNDGVGNNGDTDDDNDGVLDSEDQFPLDASRSKQPSPPSQSATASSNSGGGTISILNILLFSLCFFRQSQKCNIRLIRREV